MSERKPIIVVGAGPVGLTTALGLDFYGLPFLLFEDDAELSRDTKAGTILTRTIEAFRRYGVADEVRQGVAGRRIGDVSARPILRGRRCRRPCSAKTRATRLSSTCPSITSSRSCAMPSIGVGPVRSICGIA
jgi:2-polyprenyl-6-methoxyphenol hydroxylase-like FAD-dependent oxidoreductase